MTEKHDQCSISVFPQFSHISSGNYCNESIESKKFKTSLDKKSKASQSQEEEYPIQDAMWPSRRWNKDRTDYIDLSGGIQKDQDEMSEEMETSKDLISDLISEVKESELKKGVPARIIWPENLKQAAIKRIKYLEKINKEESKFARHEFIKGRIHELKEFCNITEEDLK